MLTLTFCSDVHLCPEEPERNSIFFNWIGQLRDTHLVIAGDLFHYWWDYPALSTKQAALLEPFLRLEDQGVTLSFVPGNHDFSYPRQLPLKGHSLPDSVKVFHGDEADRTLGYRMLSTILRGRPFGMTMKILGSRLGYFSLKLMAGSSRNMMKNNRELVTLQRSFGLKQLQAGTKWVLMGHSHHLGHEEHENGQLIWLGDWVKHHSYAVLKSNRLELFRCLDTGPSEKVLVPMKLLGAQ
jgi:UDP-2,3-diacylglucosamine pyrophosphatase LpxH